MTFTTKELLTSLNSRVCPACGGNKHRQQTFCGRCYMSLPPGMRNTLYRRIGKGYEAAFAQSMARLGKSEIKLEAVQQ